MMIPKWLNLLSGFWRPLPSPCCVPAAGALLLPAAAAAVQPERLRSTAGTRPYSVILLGVLQSIGMPKSRLGEILAWRSYWHQTTQGSGMRQGLLLAPLHWLTSHGSYFGLCHAKKAISETVNARDGGAHPLFAANIYLEILLSPLISVCAYAYAWAEE